MTRAFLDSPICANPDEYFIGEPKRASDAEDSTLALRDQATLECLDTVSVLRAHRRVLPGESWWTPERSERRMLAQIDALIGLGMRSLDRVYALAFDPDVPDPNRLFAAAFTLGCASGARWTKAAMWLLARAAERSPEELSAVTEAMCLSPNRELIQRLQPLTEHPAVRVRATAVRVLGYHGVLAEDAWRSALTDHEPAVIESGLKAFLHGYNRESCRNALRPLLDTRDEGLFRLVLQAGLTLRAGPAYQRAAELIASGAASVDCLRYVGMFGHRSAVARLSALFAGEHGAPALEAAGFLGYIELVPTLFAVLEQSAEGSLPAQRAAEALWMITGHRCETPEQRQSTRRDWQRLFAGYELTARYRYGRPLSESLLIDELKKGQLSRPARQDLYRELLALSDYHAPRFSPYDFIGVQRHALDAVARTLQPADQG